MEENVSSNREEIMNEKISGVYLQILTNNAVYDIAFKNIEQLDQYTIQFKNKADLIRTLFGENAHLINDIYIKYVYKTKEFIKEEKLPIKYQTDNFSESNVKGTFHKHLETHPEERYKKKWQVMYPITNGRNKNNAFGDIGAKELAVAIDTIWAKGYKVRRDIYFALKDLGYKIEILPTFDFSDRKPDIRKRIAGITPQDNYSEYLQSHAKLGEDERASAMEQLSMFDLEDLLKMNAPIDGAVSNDPLDTLFEHIETLSPTKRRILAEEIYRLRDDFSRSLGKNKCRK